MSSRILFRVLLTAATLALVGCSALQIDVDVYKGPLGNQREIQLRQYVALARSAKPVLLKLKSDLKPGHEQELADQQALHKERAVKPDPDKEETGTALEQVYQLLCFYDFWAGDGPECKSGADANKKSIPAETRVASESTKKLPDCAPVHPGSVPGVLGERWIRRGRSAEGIDGLHDRWLETLTQYNFDANHECVRLTEQHLTEALIIFAERMLFVVNNSKLFDSKHVDARSLLQTLGNTLLIHANDLKRQALHERHQQARFAHELRATQTANNARAPALVVKDVLKAFDDATERAKRQAVDDSIDVRATRTKVAEAQKEKQKADAQLMLAKAAQEQWDQEPLRAAVLSFVDPDAKLAFRPRSQPRFDPATAKKDKEAIDALFPTGNPPPTLSGEGFRTRVKEWISTQDIDPTLRSERLLRLRALQQFLVGGGLAFAAIPEADTSTTLAELRRQIERRREDAEKDWAGIPARIDQMAKAAEDADGNLKSAQEALTKQIKVAESSDTVEAAQKAKAVAAGLSGNLLKQAGSAGLENPEALRGAWLTALEASRDAAKDDATKVVINDAQQTLRRIELPVFAFAAADYTGKPAHPAREEPPTALAVLDDVIAQLRNRRVVALAGGRTTDASHLQAAIDAAYEQRASEIYVRPAADYLKNVYSATALQDANASANGNMLFDYVSRLGPDGDLPAARAEFEKVFWQNINRVSVAGGGATNYVLAKDDVGNWYIKAYGSDTTQIFQSARNLFLFNSGRQLDTNLLERIELRRRAGDTALSETERTSAATQLRNPVGLTSPASQDFAKRSRERFSASYLTDSQRHARELRADLTAWPESLQLAWARELTAIDKVQADTAMARLATKAKELHDAVVAKSAAALAELADAKVQTTTPATSTAELAGRVGTGIAEGLEAGRRYRQELLKAMPALNLNVTADLLDKLLLVTRQTLRGGLVGMVEKRQKASTAYTDSLTTLGDVISGR